MTADGAAPDDRPAPRNVEGIARRLVALSRRSEVSLGEILEAFGRASFLPGLVVPALIVFSPLSGIPLLPTFLGLVIGLVALQMAARRRYLWLPGFLKDRTISSRRLARGMARARPVARWIDRHSRDRLSFLLSEPFATLTRLACAACGLAMPFLELVPFSSSILALAVLLFSVGFLARDGLYVLLGAAVMGSAVSIPLVIVF